IHSLSTNQDPALCVPPIYLGCLRPTASVELDDRRVTQSSRQLLYYFFEARKVVFCLLQLLVRFPEVFHDFKPIRVPLTSAECVRPRVFCSGGPAHSHLVRYPFTSGMDQHRATTRP